MNKEATKFFKNNWAIGIVYVVFVLYLVTGFGVDNQYKRISLLLYNSSYLSLILLFIQLALWKKGKVQRFIKNKILIFSALFIINFYFLYDLYLASLLNRWLNSEITGWLLNILSVIASMALAIQCIIWLAIILKSLLRPFQFIEKND